YFPNEIGPRKNVYRLQVIGPDQLARGAWIVVLFLVASAAVFLVRLNASSLHWYYRDQIARVYLASRTGGGRYRFDDAEVSGLDTVKNGGPYHLINATLNISNLREIFSHTFGIAASGADALRNEDDANPDSSVGGSNP